MKIGICEDNPDERAKYLSLLHKSGYNDDNIFLFNSGEELIKEMPDLDLLFLDIEMDKISGIQIKNYFEKQRKNTYIVFYTTHMEAMSKCFGANVLGFLRKPVTLHELELYINKTSIRLGRNHPVPIDNGQYISSDDIAYIKSEHNYTIIYKTDKEHFIVRRPLHDWVEILAAYGFIQIHRSVIVNIYNINHITKSTITLSNGETLTASRQYINQIKEEFESMQLKLFNLS